MKYAVIQLKGRQYKVSLGKELVIDNLDKKPGETFEAEKVLMSSDGKKYQVGTPEISEKVQLEVVESKKGKKLRVATFKAKSRYRRVKGSRRHLTTVKVVGIGSEKTVAKKKETKVKKTKTSK